MRVWAFPVIFLFFFRNLRQSLRDPEFQSIAGMTLLTLLGGTVFYHEVEGWGWIDSLYFSVVTLATVGYGDLTPETSPGKLFTIVYIFVGLGIITTFVSKLLALHRERRTHRSAGEQDPGEARGA